MKFDAHRRSPSDEDNLNEWFSAGVVCVGIGSHLFSAETLVNLNYQKAFEVFKYLKDTVKKIKNQHGNKMVGNKSWISFIDTPFLAIYSDRVRYNIENAYRICEWRSDKVKATYKTHKLGEILQLFRDYGIEKEMCDDSEAELRYIMYLIYYWFINQLVY